MSVNSPRHLHLHSSRDPIFIGMFMPYSGRATSHALVVNGDEQMYQFAFCVDSWPSDAILCAAGYTQVVLYDPTANSPGLFRFTTFQSFQPLVLLAA